MSIIESTSPAQIEFLRMLANRMERLSADSIWARRASGLRRSLIKVIESIDSNQSVSSELIEQLVDHSLWMLRKAAMEVPDPEHPFYRSRKD